MHGSKKKKSALPEEAPLRAPVPEPPKLPELEREFFDILLEALAGGLMENEKDLCRPAQRGELLRRSSRLRGTVAYAQALLRLEALRRSGLPAASEEIEIAALLNLAVNGLRRSFLYAGVAVRRPEEEPAFPVRAPRELALFLLEEMLGCCLRCAPEGRNLHITPRVIGSVLLLVMRTEGPVLQQSPLIPLLPRGNENEDPAPEEDYGFAVCRVLAAQMGWAFRWEADEAGVRMFLDIR